jgi:hypothetical protein
VIILIIFLLGVYEIKSGNVGDFPLYKDNAQPTYMTVPGELLFYGAIVLFIVISYTFSKMKN